jgi:hypothetical protein
MVYTFRKLQQTLQVMIRDLGIKRCRGGCVTNRYKVSVGRVSWKTSDPEFEEWSSWFRFSLAAALLLEVLISLREKECPHGRIALRDSQKIPKNAARRRVERRKRQS